MTEIHDRVFPSVPPTDAGEWQRWFVELGRWRDDVRAEHLAETPEYGLPAARWAQDAFVCGVVMLWDSALFDAASGTFTVERYLDDAHANFGGFDALILWHAYPRIGFDDRNQFDYYRDIPGGLPALRDIITRLHARGVRAILDYNPWDTGMRPEGEGHEEAIARLVHEVDADGVFLDTMEHAPTALRASLDRRRQGIVFQSEHIVPLSAIKDHLISWVQWPEGIERPLVLRNKWIEPRQMQHLVQRWHASHHDELVTAWLNGTGVVVWENVFGSLYPWSSRDQATLAQMRIVQKAVGDGFSLGEWTPFVSNAEGVEASRWQVRPDLVVWTTANRTTRSVSTGLDLDELPTNWRVADVFARCWLQPERLRHHLDSNSIGCLLAMPDTSSHLIAWVTESLFSDVSARSRVAEPALSAVSLPAIRVRHASSNAAPDTHAARIPAGRRTVRSRFLGRECGTYERAQYRDEKFPQLDTDIEFVHDVALGSVVVANQPATNADFAEFLLESGYRPHDGHNFLAKWQGGYPPSDLADDPVVWVALEDARAFARWKGARLPTEFEWQVALEATEAGYGRRRVWELTESEHDDGHNRFVIVKGGSDWAPEGSAWYAEGGPLTPDRSAKYLLFAPSFDRSGTIGFRLAWDV